MRVLPLVALLSLLPTCRCIDPLERRLPHMKVTPSQVVLEGVPITQDTRIVIQVTNDSTINLGALSAHLADGADPAFSLEPDFPVEVFAGQTGEIVVIVRPMVASSMRATLVIDGICAGAPCAPGDGAKPADHVEVPLTVNAIDAGVPDICEYPEAIAFGVVGQNDDAREAVRIKNCGVRTLIVDHVEFCATPTELEQESGAECGADSQIFLGTVIEDEEFPPQSSASLELLFVPVDLVEHGGELRITSNDPDEDPVVIPVVGRGSACPTAVAALVDDDEQFEPNDTVQLSGSQSVSSDSTTPGSFVGRFEWTLRSQPLGSTTSPFPNGAASTEVLADLAGRYVVDLHVFETVYGPNDSVLGEVRSCEPSTVSFDVIPTEELLVQLVWDNEVADFDLHLVRGGGDVFTFADDCYFSNREPAQTLEHPEWSSNAEENPVLDVDDTRGYGPENLNIVAPADSSQWRVFVHYWDDQTDGDPRATATVRVFVHGQQALELSRVFESDQQLWQALDIEWPSGDDETPSFTQLGVTEPFPRPFGG